MLSGRMIAVFMMMHTTHGNAVGSLVEGRNFMTGRSAERLFLQVHRDEGLLDTVPATIAYFTVEHLSATSRHHHLDFIEEIGFRFLADVPQSTEVARKVRIR